MQRRDDLDRFFDYGIHVPTRQLFMGTETDDEMAELFLKGMAMLSTSHQPITVIMNNMGGDEYDGLAIYDAIATCPSHVTVIAYGHAMSMGSWILQAADERVMSPHATMMLHYGTWGDCDHVPVVRKLMAEGERLNQLMERTYLERIKQADPKYTLRALRKILETDTYLTAQQAVEMGLADKILGGGGN
ncbi:MAG: hypothetical protein AMJ65_01660 [Phycisphaerae bacterium SG8_4]|nr:MAG: hypothetical protein AMJ65_01660 [Phycisphaerae bacterium SG8_4]